MAPSADWIVSAPNDDRPPRNPKRVAAGRLNYQKRRGLSAKGRERIRQAAIAHRPSQFSTGPKTAVGKARCSVNLRSRKIFTLDPSTLAALTAVQTFLTDMAAHRREITKLSLAGQ